ncbi:hypothetical protein ACFXTN_031696 [Malus domestica]
MCSPRGGGAQSSASHARCTNAPATSWDMVLLSARNSKGPLRAWFCYGGDTGTPKPRDGVVCWVMHYGESSCYQGCKNIEIKTVVLEEPDCVMILVNWFDAESFHFKFLSAVVEAC